MMKWILIIIAIIVIFLALQFLKKWIAPKIKPKTNLLLSFVWFIIFGAFITIRIAVKNYFTPLQLIVLIGFAVIYLISFYYRYKKLTNKKHSAIQQ